MFVFQRIIFVTGFGAYLMPAVFRFIKIFASVDAEQAGNWIARNVSVRIKPSMTSQHVTPVALWVSH